MRKASQVMKEKKSNGHYSEMSFSIELEISFKSLIEQKEKRVEIERRGFVVKYRL